LTAFPEIPPLDAAAAAAARQRIDRKTKPPGSLGKLEDLAVRLAGMRGPDPQADPARLVISIADHGIVAEGVSAWPQEVTGQMAANFLAGGAAANVLARQSGCEVQVTDAGIARPQAPHPDLAVTAARRGTRNAAVEDAMTPAEADRMLAAGMQLAKEAARDGVRTLLLGEMGIGNTASAALVGQAVSGIPVRDLAGPGAGLDSKGVQRKIEVLEKAVARHPRQLRGRDALCKFGGLEVAQMAGLVLGGAAERRVILVDGFIATAAVAAAAAESPRALDYCVFAHRSAEPGHARLLNWLGASPLLDLGLRLGEGTGGLLALPLLRSAAALLREMAEFDEAGVAGRQKSE